MAKFMVFNQKRICQVAAVHGSEARLQSIDRKNVKRISLAESNRITNQELSSVQLRAHHQREKVFEWEIGEFYSEDGEKLELIGQFGQWQVLQIISVKSLVSSLSLSLQSLATSDTRHECESIFFFDVPSVNFPCDCQTFPWALVRRQLSRHQDVFNHVLTCQCGSKSNQLATDNGRPEKSFSIAQWTMLSICRPIFNNL